MNFFQVLAHSLALFTICTARPQVAVLNGTYEGNHVSGKQQDQFFGIPYAHPPIGDLRFRAPQSLNESWSEKRAAREYSDVCMQYMQYEQDVENLNITLDK
jgi:carboxylesterase type B